MEIGKWLRIEGIIYSIREHSSADEITVSVDLPKVPAISLVFLEFDRKRWEEELVVFKPNEKIAAIGEIRKVDLFTLDLTNCLMTHDSD